MEEDCYVETSDMEELDDAYERTPCIAPDDAGPTEELGVGGLSKPVQAAPEDKDYEAPRKRRKLSHPAHEEVGISTSPVRNSEGSVHDLKNTVTNETTGGIKMEVDATPGSALSEYSQGIPRVDLTRDGPVLRDAKAWGSSTTPKKISGLQSGTPSRSVLTLVGLDRNILHHVEQPIIPPAPASDRASSRSQNEAIMSQLQEESEDELAAFPPRSTSPISVSQTGSGTSEDNLARDESPLSFPSSSPPSPGVSGSRGESNTVHRAEKTLSSRNPAVIADILEDEPAVEQRYSLRRRQPNQLRPYLYDEYQYKTVLKNNPAAIINALRLPRHVNLPEDRYEEEEYVEEESQQQAIERDGDAETQEEHPGSPSQPLPAFLEPLTDSSGDEGEDLAKEARRMERVRRKKEKEERERHRQRLREENEARRRLKRFPSSYDPADSNRSHLQEPDAQAPSTSRQARNSPISANREPQRSLSEEGRIETHALRDYFMDDFILGGNDETNASTSQPLQQEERLSQQNHADKQGTEVGDDASSAPESSGDSDGESDQELQKFMKKQYRILFRMYPPKVAKELLRKNRIKFIEKRHRLTENNTTEDGPLLPGQSRVRKAINPKDIKDIRGDSESEEEEVRLNSPQPLYNGDIRDFLDYESSGVGRSQDYQPENTQERRRSPLQNIPDSPTPVHEIIVISDEEASSGSEEEQVDQEDINSYLGDDTPDILSATERRHNVPVKEESLIDWMLSRTRIVGTTISKPKISKLKRHPSRRSGNSAPHSTNPSRPRHRFDVITRDARKYGNERQALLNFSHHASAKKPGSNSDTRPKAGSATEPIEVQIQAPEPEQRKSWKERQKERKERAKRRGVYSMANPRQAMVTSGRSKGPVKVTIDTNDDDFYESFARHPVKKRSSTMPVDKGNARADTIRDRTTDVYDIPQRSPDTSNTQQPRSRKRLRRRSEDCTTDLSIGTLQPGIKFSLTTFIGKGWLYELLDIIANGTPLPPEPTYLCGLSIYPSMGLDAFLRDLDQIFDGLLGLFIDIPSDGYEDKVKDWNILTRSACRFISWFRLQHDGDNDCNRLSTFVRDKVLSVVSNLYAKEIPVAALDVVLLSLCWFCIETSVRAGHRFSDALELADLNPLTRSVRLILRYLVPYSLRKVYKVVRKHQILEDSKVSSYAAQNWICLIHLLPACNNHQPNDNKEDPLWQEMLYYYQSLPQVNALETSEKVWKSIFVLMALSQFSSHGISTGTHRLSSSWALVAYAVKQLQLAQNTEKLQLLAQGTLEKRDEYVSIVISRCYHLMDYWKWKMDHSFGALNQLVDIFRARNFVDLRHEGADYPDFMLNSDWNSLSQLRAAGDTAFTSVLKLLMRAIDSGSLAQSEIRKMLALIIPISRFRTQKDVVPDANDLSPICNRLAAIALAIAIDRESASRRIAQVQKCIDFKESDLSTQTLTVRGIRLLASLMIEREIPVPGVTEWLRSIVDDAVSEFKTLRSLRYMAQDKQREHESRTRNYVLLILALYAAGRLIMETYASKKCYPNIGFLLAFKSLLEPEASKAVEEANCNMYEMRRFVESFLDARTKYLPLPEYQLPTIQADDPDSQDYGDFDFGIDFNDPTTLAQLGDQGHSFLAIKEEEQQLLQTVIFPCFWVAQRKIKRFCEAAVDLLNEGDMTQLRTFDSWTYCFIGCMHILIQHGTLSDWSFCLSEIVPLWTRIRYGWLRVRVQLAIYLEILRHDPTFCTSQGAKLVDLLFESLAMFNVTIEYKYWRRVVLHEASKNALFKDATAILPMSDLDDLASSEYKDFQISLLRVVFKNIESSLQAATVPEGIELCFKLLSMIRSNSQDLAHKPDDRANYHLWCKTVFALFQDYPRLRSQPRLAFLLHWGTMLDTTLS